MKYLIIVIVAFVVGFYVNEFTFTQQIDHIPIYYKIPEEKSVCNAKGGTFSIIRQPIENSLDYEYLPTCTIIYH